MTWGEQLTKEEIAENSRRWAASRARRKAEAEALATEKTADQRETLATLRGRPRVIDESIRRMTDEEALRRVICAQRENRETLTLEMRNLQIYWLYDVDSEHKTPDPKHVIRCRKHKYGARRQGHGY